MTRLTLWMALVSALVLTPVPVSAAAGPCGPDAVVLVHDLARDAASTAPLARVLAADGHCVVNRTYGRNRPPFDGLPGGMASADVGADEVGRAVVEARRLAPRGQVHVVAHGTGALVAMRLLQRGAAEVASLTSLAPPWDGTNLLGLGTLEQLSRDLGTYPLVLAIEKPLEDPVCAMCREMIHGSDLLREMRAAGLDVPGVRRTDVVTRTALLHVPWTTGVVPGARTVVLQDERPGALVWEPSLPDDPTVQRLVVDAVRAAGR